MSLEGFSKKGMELGNNIEGINETKNNLHQQYLSAIKRLALDKMKNDILFEGKLEATMRNLSSSGLNISRENLLKDIQKEIGKQRMGFDLEADFSIATPSIDIPSYDTSSQIDQLKNNLGNLFESAPVQEQRTINVSGLIPREPAIQSTMISESNVSSKNEHQVKQTPIHTKQEEQNINEKLQKEVQEISQKLEWAKQQANTPLSTYIGDLTNLSDAVKQKIIQQMEIKGKGEVIISEIENIYQEGNYIVVDAKNNQGHFIGAEFTLDEFSKLVSQLQDKIETNSSPLSSLSSQQPIERKSNDLQQSLNAAALQVAELQQPQMSISNKQLQQIENNELKQKTEFINQIIFSMVNAGEFSYIGDISQKIDMMNNVKKKLESKSAEELQFISSKYKVQNIGEDTLQSGMHR